MSDAPALVAIFGTGRSGSTLLARLLDGMPGAYVHPGELNLLSSIDDLAAYGRVRWRTGPVGDYHVLRHLDRAVPTERLIEYYREQKDWICDDVFGVLVDPPDRRGDPWQYLAAKKSWRAVEFIPALLAAFARWLRLEADRALVFKTIETPYIPDYEAMFPDMKFVHIIRNPVDTWSSLKRTTIALNRQTAWHHGGDSLKTLIYYRWRMHLDHVLRRLDSPRHAVILYEDLVRDPEGSIESACAKIGIPAPREPARLTMFGRPFSKLGVFVSQKGVETPSHVVADLKSRHAYDDVVTARERDFIMMETWEPGRRLGYYPGAALPDPARVAASWVFPDRWEFENNRTVRDWVLALRGFLWRRVYIGSRCTARMFRFAKA